MRIQVAGLSNPEDVRFAFKAGVDAVGLTVGLPEGPHDGLTAELAGEIVRSLDPFSTTVLITYVRDFDGLVELLAATGAPVLQAHGDHEPAILLRVRRRFPALRLIKSVNVTGPESEPEARRWLGLADALILDTYDAATGRLGATGLTHDWELSRGLVRSLPVPVMLAGGLTPENVGAAIEQVRPWGVDVHTGVETEGRLDRSKLLAFVRSARSAGSRLQGR